MTLELAVKMRECYSNVVIISPLHNAEFLAIDGKYNTLFYEMVKIFHDAVALKMIGVGDIACLIGNWTVNTAARSMKKKIRCGSTHVFPSGRIREPST